MSKVFGNQLVFNVKAMLSNLSLGFHPKCIMNWSSFITLDCLVDDSALVKCRIRFCVPHGHSYRVTSSMS